MCQFDPTFPLQQQQLALKATIVFGWLIGVSGLSVRFVELVDELVDELVV